jgi:hypothetical protein
MGLLRTLFGPTIDHELQQQDDRDIHGDADDHDFASYRLLKRWVAEALENYSCPSCGNHRVSGSGVIVKYGKVHLYRSVATKGWFGGTKYNDQFVKTVWRVHEISLRPGPCRALLNLFGLFSERGGELKCNARGCDWKVAEAGSWGMSVLDVYHQLGGK